MHAMVIAKMNAHMRVKIWDMRIHILYDAHLCASAYVHKHVHFVVVTLLGWPDIRNTTYGQDEQMAHPGYPHSSEVRCESPDFPSDKGPPPAAHQNDKRGTITKDERAESLATPTAVCPEVCRPQGAFAPSPPLPSACPWSPSSAARVRSRTPRLRETTRA